MNIDEIIDFLNETGQTKNVQVLLREKYGKDVILKMVGRSLPDVHLGYELSDIDYGLRVDGDFFGFIKVTEVTKLIGDATLKDVRHTLKVREVYPTSKRVTVYQ